jgi:hypothetical protein
MLFPQVRAGVSHLHRTLYTYIYFYNSVICRSPGGNPIKRPVTPSDPSNVLAAVLKKKFADRNDVSMGDESQV